jgi:hypothetical protein
MLIRLASDLHNEFSNFTIPKLEGDSETVLVLAGDICVREYKSSYESFFDDVTSRFKHVLFLCGNHVYYKSSILSTERTFRELESKYNNFHFLQKGIFEQDGVVFLGATLWTDLKNFDPIVSYKVENTLNDYKLIRHGTGAEPYKYKFRAMHSFTINQDHKKFIFDNIKKFKSEGKKIVVVTHHTPSWQSVPDRFKSDDISYGYSNQYDYDLLDFGPEYWLHGHTHDSFDYVIGNTRVICNPRGYSKETNGAQNPNFDPLLRLEL